MIRIQYADEPEEATSRIFAMLTPRCYAELSTCIDCVGRFSAPSTHQEGTPVTHLCGTDERIEDFHKDTKAPMTGKILHIHTKLAILVCLHGRSIVARLRPGHAEGLKRTAKAGLLRPEMDAVALPPTSSSNNSSDCVDKAGAVAASILGLLQAPAETVADLPPLLDWRTLVQSEASLEPKMRFMCKENTAQAMRDSTAVSAQPAHAAGVAHAAMP